MRWTVKKNVSILLICNFFWEVYYRSIYRLWIYTCIDMYWRMELNSIMFSNKKKFQNINIRYFFIRLFTAHFIVCALEWVPLSVVCMRLQTISIILNLHFEFYAAICKIVSEFTRKTFFHCFKACHWQHLKTFSGLLFMRSIIQKKLT